MSDDLPNLDLAQRIVEAMNRTTEPRITADGEFDPETGTVIGEVPEHLRHLHNLVVECGDEVREAEKQLKVIIEHHEITKLLFFTALEEHVPHECDKHDAVKLCTNWRVVGVNRDSDDGMISTLDIIMRGMPPIMF